MFMMMTLWWWLGCSGCGYGSSTTHQFTTPRGPIERQHHAGVGAGNDRRASTSSQVVRRGAVHGGTAAAALGAPCRPAHHRHPLHGPRTESRTTLQVQGLRRVTGGPDRIAVWVRAAVVLATYWRYVPVLRTWPTFKHHQQHQTSTRPRPQFARFLDRSS